MSELNLSTVLMGNIIDGVATPFNLSDVVHAADRLFEELSMRLLPEDLFDEVYHYALFRSKNPLHSACRSYCSYALYLASEGNRIADMVRDFCSENELTLPRGLKSFEEALETCKGLALPADEDVTEQFLVVMEAEGEEEADILAIAKYREQLTLLSAQSQALAYQGKVVSMGRRLRAKKISDEIELRMVQFPRKGNPTFKELFEMNRSLAAYLRRREGVEI